MVSYKEMLSYSVVFFTSMNLVLNITKGGENQILFS